MDLLISWLVETIQKHQLNSNKKGKFLKQIKWQLNTLKEE